MSDVFKSLCAATIFFTLLAYQPLPAQETQSANDASNQPVVHRRVVFLVDSSPAVNASNQPVIVFTLKNAKATQAVDKIKLLFPVEGPLPGKTGYLIGPLGGNDTRPRKFLHFVLNGPAAVSSISVQDQLLPSTPR